MAEALATHGKQIANRRSDGLAQVTSQFHLFPPSFHHIPCFVVSRFVRHTVTNLTYLDKVIGEADDQKKMIARVQWLTK